jgi:hypothetical protein
MVVVVVGGSVVVVVGTTHGVIASPKVLKATTRNRVHNGGYVLSPGYSKPGKPPELIVHHCPLDSSMGVDVM